MDAGETLVFQDKPYKIEATVRGHELVDGKLEVVNKAQIEINGKRVWLDLRGEEPVVLERNDD